MLEEGKEYLFRIEKETTTPDKKDYWVLSGPGERRFLIPVKYYRGYGFEPGREIICRIDRINCSGQVFLEPRHPFYEEGSKYPFKVISSGYVKDETGTSVLYVVVKDGLDNLITTQWKVKGEVPVPGQEIILRIERIYKGKPVFAPNGEKEKFRGYRSGKYYDFTLLRTRKGPDGEQYYIVTDRKGEIHTLPVKFYEHYNLKQGTVFRGRIVKYSSDGKRIIEPKSPFYRQGAFIRLELINTYTETAESGLTLELKDKYGFIHFIRSDKLPEKKYLKGRVKRIKKGRPEIILL
ncbi:MAG: hypothetical protein GYA43_11190 [Bacteroidales bacterium]|nr:hypothetical protein [Bacteroidales bacterium]